MKVFSPIEYILRRPFWFVVSGCICVIAINVCRTFLDIRDVRILLSILNGFGQLLFLTALGELAYQVVQHKRKESLVRLLLLALLVGATTLVVIVRTGASMYRYAHL